MNAFLRTMLGAAADLFRTRPADGWPDAYAERWSCVETMLRDLDAVLGRRPARPTRRLLVFSAMPAWTDFSLATSVALAGHGCQVDFAFTPYPHVQDQPLSDDELARLARSAPAVRHPRLRVFNLLQVRPARATPEIVAEAEEAAFTDAQYITRREEIDLKPGSPAQAVYELRLARDLRTMTGLATLLRKGRYDGMVMPNGWVLEFGAAYRMARLAGLRCATIEVHDRKHHIHAGQTVPVLCQDYEDVWQADEPHVCSPERDRRVQRFLAGRATGDWAEYFWRCQNAPPAAAEVLLRQVGLEPGRPTALLCANVACDSVVLGRKRAFASMADWIRQTVDQFAGRPDWQLIVRAHPAEQIMAPDESVESIVRAHVGQALPANVRLVLPADPVNTYALMSAAHLGLVYNSTAGLEMAASGLPVVVAGQCHYGGKGFTADPATPRQYARAVHDALTGDLTRMPARQVELARCYLDLYFHALPFPFPWAVGDPDNLRHWPISRLFSAEGRARYGRTFAFLAGEAVPIAERLKAAA